MLVNYPIQKVNPFGKSLKKQPSNLIKKRTSFINKRKTLSKNNLQAKLDLIKLAESLKDSEDWETQQTHSRKYNLIGKK